MQKSCFSFLILAVLVTLTDASAPNGYTQYPVYYRQAISLAQKPVPVAMRTKNEVPQASSPFSFSQTCCTSDHAICNACAVGLTTAVWCAQVGNNYAGCQGFAAANNGFVGSSSGGCCTQPIASCMACEMGMTTSTFCRYVQGYTNYLGCEQINTANTATTATAIPSTTDFRLPSAIGCCYDYWFGGANSNHRSSGKGDCLVQRTTLGGTLWDKRTCNQLLETSRKAPRTCASYTNCASCVPLQGCVWNKSSRLCSVASARECRATPWCVSAVQQCAAELGATVPSSGSTASTVAATAPVDVITMSNVGPICSPLYTCHTCTFLRGCVFKDNSCQSIPDDQLSTCVSPLCKTWPHECPK